MKISERIQAVLKLHPEFQETRRQLKAFAYLAKHNPKRYEVKLSHGMGHQCWNVYLNELLPNGNFQTLHSIYLPKPLKDYPATEGEKMISQSKLPSPQPTVPYAGVSFPGLKEFFQQLFSFQTQPPQART